MDITKSSLKVFAALVCKSLFNFVAVVVFSRELGASLLGIYYPFIALVGILTVPADFGIKNATQKRISEGEDASTYLGSAIALKLPILFTISVLLLLGRNYINQFLGTNLAILLIITLLVNQAADLALSVLRGELRVGETAIIEFLRPASWLVVGYVLYRNGYGVSSLVYGYLIGSILMVVVGWWKTSVSFSRPTVRHVSSLSEYAKFSVVSSIGGYFYSWMDVIVLTLFVIMGIASNRADIGAYENAWRLSLVVMMLTRAISTALFPQISRWKAENATDRIESLISRSLLPGALLVIPVFVGTMVLSKDLLRVLYGPEFTIAWLVLIILSGEKIFQSIHSILGKALGGMDRPDLAAYATIAAIVVNLILNIALIYYFGIVGAAIATTVASITMMSFQFYYLRKIINITFPVNEATWSMIASIMMGVCIYGVHSVIEIHTIADLTGVIIIGIIVYLVIALAYKPIRTTVQRTLRSFASDFTA